MFFFLGFHLRAIHNLPVKKAILISVVAMCAAVFIWVYWTERTVDRGRQAFARYGCASCHYAGGAPNLQNVGSKYDRETLTRFLRDPDSIYRARGYRPLNNNFQPMPKMKLAEDDIPGLVAYLRALSDQ